MILYSVFDDRYYDQMISLLLGHIDIFLIYTASVSLLDTDSSWVIWQTIPTMYIVLDITVNV